MRIEPRVSPSWAPLLEVSAQRREAGPVALWEYSASPRNRTLGLPLNTGSHDCTSVLEKWDVIFLLKSTGLITYQQSGLITEA